MSFPQERLRPDDKALVLFCAKFGGRQDAAFYRAAGVRDVKCLDINHEALEEMRPQYPRPWLFVSGDAFTEIDEGKPKTYDVISCDQFSNHDADVLVRLSSLLKMAKRMVVISWCAESLATPLLLGRVLADAGEAGWTVEFINRSRHAGGCFWLVFEKKGVA